MSKLRRFAMRRDNVMIRLAIMVMVPVMLMASVSFRAYAQSGYVIYDGEERHVVLSEATEPSEVLSEAGLELGRADLIEMNEAFAAQAAAVNAELGLTPDNVNVNGGAIAIGHPIGASGARILVTLCYEMARREAKYGVASLCIGGGIGEALIVAARTRPKFIGGERAVYDENLL